MLSEELDGICMVLGEFLGKLSPDDADKLRRIRRNLDAAADQARALEQNISVKEAA